MKFEELKLTYGYPLQLQTATLSGQPERFSCRLIGCLPGRSILLSVPKQAGKLVRLRTGQKVVARFMIDNGIGIFAAIVESQSSDPYPILHLSYPESITFKGIRGATRVGVREPLDAVNTTQGDNLKSTGFIADMSISGARVELQNEIAEIGDTLECRSEVHICDIKRELILKGIVRSRVEPRDNLGDSVLVSYGIEFIDQPEDERLVIYAYVFSQTVQQESSAL